MDTIWSTTEKKVAKRAFDEALVRECAALIERAKVLAEKAEQPDDIWALNDYLTEQRDLIYQKYDDHYSQLIFVFAQLLYQKWIGEQDIEGLSEEKLQAIRFMAGGLQ
ncbi:hypothetical protein [Massilia glaciei]|nr:hypothetical protein [Massilia glaciei]